jgi:hypothetical protein
LATPTVKNAKRQSVIRRIIGVSVLIPIFGVPAVLAAVAFAAFIVSYNWTYVDLTPEFSGEEFIQMRIGPISAKLPAAF